MDKKEEEEEEEPMREEENRGQAVPGEAWSAGRRVSYTKGYNS